MANATKSKRFRLSFVGPIEDQPRLIRAYGRACDGEFAMVMRPSEARAVLVLITKKDGAFVWRSDAGAAEDGLVHATATVLRDGQTKLRIDTGEHKGAAFRPHEDLASSVAHGDVVEVAFEPDDQFAHVVGAGAGGDALLRPETPISAADAVALIKSEQKKVPNAGPTTLRGRWTGYLHCEGGKPRVELKRRLATYGTLTVSSHMGAGWSWSFERTEKWFSDEGDSTGEGIATLSEAIEAGVLGAMSLVREACSFRDTRRRAAHDSDYAEKHPIRTPKPMKNPTERLQMRNRGRTRRAASPPKPIDDGTPKPEVATSEAGLGRMVEVANREGEALAGLSGRRWIWADRIPPADIAAWLEEQGFSGLGEAINEYSAAPDYPLTEFMQNLEKDLLAAETVHDDDPDPALYAEARRRLVVLKQSLEATPATMERARKLIRYAGSMVKSPICKGRERKEAMTALKSAVKAYEEARAAILEGKSWDALKTLRLIGEKVALAAAKAGRNCSAGQTSLTALASEPAGEFGDFDRMPKKRTEGAYNYARRLLSEATTRVGEGHHHVVRELLDQARKVVVTLSSSKATRLYEQIRHIEGRLDEAMTPPGWAPFEVGDRASYEGVVGTVTRTPASDHRPTDKVTFLADGRRRGRRLEARLLRRDGTGPHGVTSSGVPNNAEKDSVLVDAFSAAIAAALSDEAAA